MSSVSAPDLIEEASLLDTYDLVSLLRGRAELQPLETAYVFLADGERERIRLSFSDVDRSARSIAARLQNLGLTGQRALLLYPPGLDYIEAFFGCLYAGVIAVPAYPPSGRHLQRLQAIFRDASPALVMTVKDLRDRFAAGAEGSLGQGAVSWLATDELDSNEANAWTPFAAGPDSLAFLQYTSGSTGNPRGVMVSHANLLFNQELIRQSFQHTKHSTLVGWLPLYHDMGLIGNILQPLFVGSAAYLMSPLAFLEKPFRWLRAISTYRAHTSGGPNFAYDLCARKITREQKRDLDLSCWTVAFSGAEPVRATTLDRFAAAFADCGFRRENFFPCYGLAEATLVVTAPTRGRSVALRRADRNALGANRIAEATTGAPLALVGCGHTWPGHEVRIVNPETAVPCTDGEIGEIWAAGPSMAKGYWNQPEDSVRVFQARLVGEDAGHFLRTGDLGFLEHGELFVTGRLKDLIIIAGRNHYPQDFERVLDEHVEALRPGSSAAFSVTNDDQEALVIVAEPQRGELQSLRDHGPHTLFQKIRESLAGECDVAPAEIVLVQPGSIPKTSSGKVRRASCRQDYLSGRLPILARSRREPASSALARDIGMPPSAEGGNPLLREALALLAPQQRIGLIARFLISNTAQLLRIPESDLSENTRIMTSGLESLRALELKHVLDVLLGADIPLPLLLADMTFSQIAEALNSLANANGDVHAFQDADPCVSYELSHAQQAMWTVQQLDPSGVAYNLHLALRIKGRVDSCMLKRSLDYLLERHPVLRGVYQEESEGIVQTLLPLISSEDHFSIVNAEGWAEDKLQKDLGSEAIRPFDLASGPVLRMTLYRHGDDSATLLLCAHHIALDLWSLLIFLKELEEVYKVICTQQAPNLPRIAANYQDFVAWQRQYLDSQASDADWAYWRSHLAGDLPILALATDHPRPPAPTNLGSAFRLQLDTELTAGLKTVARAHGATLFMVLLAAYKILLYRHTHQRDIIVGSASSGRSKSRFAPVVGNFVNPLALRTNLRPEQPFSDYLSEVRNCVTGALEHQDFPFSVLVERLQPERIAGQWPIFQTWFVLQQAQADVASGYAQLALGESGAPLSFGDWQVEALALDDRVERFDLKLMAAETDQGLILSFQYCRDLFCEDTIVHLAGHFRSLVEAIVAAPRTCIAALPLLDEGETCRQLAVLQGTEEAVFPAACVHHIFTEWVRKTPEATALICADHRVTYAELESRANQLAHFLRSKGVDRNVPVGLCVTRSAETIIALLGILKAGGAYIPIDPDLPSLRIAGMLQDTGAKILLCRQGWFERSSIVGAEPIFLDGERIAIDAQPNNAPAVRNSPLDLAYIIFTSGSTGLPKGVAITHQSLANYTTAILGRLPAECGLHFGLVSTLAADLGNTVLFPALASGGCLHVLTYNEATDPQLFSAYLARHPIDVLKIVPSHYNALVRPGAEAELLPRKALIFGGEALPGPLAKRVLSVARPPQLFNHYGPTETTVGALMFSLADDLDASGRSAIPIGRPIENTRAFVLGPDLTFQPQGMSGEICLGGVGLARGYLGHPDLTAERFVPDPFASRPGERLYRTGDLGSVTRHGDIEFLGRIDQQVKIRGFRIELGEIESRLNHHASVAQAVVVALADRPDVSCLAAYVVLEKDSAVEEDVLRAHLRQLLPEYMVPSAFLFLDAIPVTQNGKIDRKRLPIPNPDVALQIHRAPRNEVEANLADIYASLLHIDRIGIDDNFFALGGDSILSIQAASRAHAAGLNISPRQIFQHQTIAELSTAIASLPAAAKPSSPTGPSSEDFPLSNLGRSELDRLTADISNIEDIYPLTPLQEGLLFHTLSQPNTGVYVMQHRYWIDGEIDVSVFRAAWQCIVDTHPIFRTAFIWDGFSRTQQIVHQDVELPIDYLDLRQSTKAEQDKQLNDLLAQERLAGFDLGKAPLVRIRLVHLEDNHYLLIRSHHHILFDAWCTSLILSELQSNYGALIKGQNLPRRTGLDFRDYIAWLQRQDLNAAEAFWREYLEDFSEPTPLIVAPLSGGQSEAKESIEDLVFYLSEDDTAELKALAQRYQVTPNTFAQAALALLLAQYASRRDVLFGVTVSGRPAELPEVESILGLFINGLPLRVSVNPSESLPSFLRKVLEHNYAIRDYEYVSLTQVQNWSEIPRGVELFQYLLTFENAPVDSTLLEPTGDWWFTDCQHRTHTNYPITFVVIPGPRLHLQLTYDRRFVDAASAERLLFHYRCLLEGMIRRPESRLGDLGLLSASERHCHLEEWNATAHDYGEPCDLVGRFEAQVLKSPAAVAASCGGVTLSYQALNEKANRLAHALIGEGVGPDGVVALLDERGLDFLAMMLAIFKAGAAYLPLDPAHPDGRIAQVLEESHVSLLLAGAACRERAAAIVAAMSEPKPRLLDLAACDARESCRENPPRRHRPQNLAFVIYTSGSTGKPKGAIVEHQGMFNNLITKVPALELTALDVIAQTASQCFDISVWQFLTALTLGARVEIFPDAISRDPQRLLEEIAARGVTVLEAVPSMIRALLDASESGAAFAGLRWLLPCGEAFAPELCRRFMERHPHVRLLNAYGPAECSDDVSYYPILTPPGGNDLSVPIGRPVDNTRLYLLNRWLEPVPVGAPGEICVGGVQVGRGYLNRPDLTAAAFLPDPFGPPGTRLYHTGDLGRYRADGVIEFLGRVDHQVKIRGHRIEPGEVEAGMATHPRVHATAVVAHPAGPGLYRLVAYVVGAVEADELRHHLRATLPDYMIPAAFVHLDALPLTPNGKVDRKALPEPDLSAQLARRFMAPRTPTEEILAQIWADVLRVERVGINDNFFELGGDSILSIQIVSRARQAGLMLMPKQIFDLQSIAELAAAAETRCAEAEQGEVEGEAPLTPIQHWFFEQQLANADHWNLTVLLEVRGALRPADLDVATRHLVGHHDALRMRFRRRDDERTAFNVASEKQDVFHVEDLSQIMPDQQPEALTAAAEHWQKSLRLDTGPLLQVIWFDLGPARPAQLLIIIHHLVVDGVSLRILLEDLDTACRQLAQGEAIALPAKTTSYRAWANRLHDAAKNALPENEIAYWDELVTTPRTPLRVEYPSGSEIRAHTRQITIKLDSRRTRALLQDVPTAYRTRINDVLLAVLGQAIGQWNVSQDVLIDVEGHGREEIFPNIDVTRTVGWFTAIYPVLLTVGKADPGTLLKSIKEQLRAVPGNGFWYGVKRYLTNTSQPQISAPILFNYLGQLDQALSPKSAFGPSRGSSGTNLSPAGRRRHEWEIVGDVTDECLRIHWRYSGERYSDATIQSIADICKSELEALIDHCLSVDAGGFTPSDFPLSSLAQSDLDRLIAHASNVEDIYPLAPMQHGLLLHTLLNPHSGIYLMQDVIDLKGKLDVQAFEQAWQQVVDSHSVLRTAFYWTTDKQPHQIVFKSVKMSCELFDWRSLPETVQRDQLHVMLETELAAGLTLDRAPILRMRLIHIGEDRWIYIRSHHHILLDAWCLPLLLADFLHYYEALLAKSPVATRRTTPYRAYIEWLRQQDLRSAEQYWRSALKGFTTPTYLTVRRNAEDLPVGEVEVADAHAELSVADTIALHQACRKHRLTPSAFLQGAWALLMFHYLNRQEVLFGVTVAGRPAELDQVEEMAGLFINTLPFRTTVDPKTLLLDWLQTLLSQTAEMRQYEYAPLADIQKWSDIERGQQLFDSFIVFENVPIHPTLKRENLPLEVLNYTSRTHSNYPLNLSIRPHESLSFKLTYDRRFVDAASAERLLFHYRCLLEGMIRRPESRLGDLGLLSASERHCHLEEWNATAHDYGEPCDLVGRFEAQVLKSPAAVAASCGGVTLSYQALNEKANRLAHALIGEGVGPDGVVALLDERGLDFLAMMLAIFKAGAAYLPLDPAHPDGRIAQVLEESHVSLLLAGAACRERAAAIVAAMSEPKPRLLDLAACDARESCRENPPRRHRPQNLAFVIYTSGSTGKPKGAIVEHQGMFNNLITKVPALELTALDVIAQTASQCFDISVWQFLTALTLGARVEIFPDAISRDPQRLLEEIAARGVTVLEAVPSMIRALLDASESGAAFAGLRWLLPCGEAFAPELCRRFMERHPHVRLLNAYGPAECSDDVSYYPILTPPGGNDLSVPIGRPVDNTRLYLLNRWLEPVPVGAPGEICVGGVQVGRGYLNRPDLTAAAFLPDPFGPPGTRLYHTGDLGRYRADGVIEFLGRVDHQVKIRGHRIEPGEVEAGMATHPRVHATAVVAHPAGPGLYRLVAYVVGAVEADELRHHLRATLPDYMIPAAFVHLDALPLTPNGKVDRKALPEPDLSAQLARRFMAPRTPTEEILAQIWADVLRVERVGINDNFFELGGHSLMATRIASRIRSAFAVDIPLRALFEAHTVEAMAEAVNAGTLMNDKTEAAASSLQDYEDIEL